VLGIFWVKTATSNPETTHAEEGDKVGDRHRERVDKWVEEVDCEGNVETTQHEE
jgi:hypothetical protein